MSAITWKYFEDGMKFLAETYDQELSAGRLNIYWNVLKELTKEEFAWALGMHAESSQWFPKPSELKALAGTFYERVTRDEMERRDAERKREQADYDEGFRAWRSDPGKVEADKARFARIRAHAQGKHKDAPVDGCDSCLFEVAHPAPHLHLKDGIVAADVVWTIRVAGCCLEPAADWRTE